MGSKMQKPYIGNTCEVCIYGIYDIPLSGQEWHVVCNECGAIKLVYEPLPHQAKFHADPHKYRLFAGGYGSAKTTTACMEIVDHVLNTPNGLTLIGAATLPQLEQTAQKEFLEVFPKELITGVSKQKNYLDTVNGHRVLFRPLDDEQKARSLNLTAFWIEEFNGVKFEYYVQLTTRLRNKATDKHLGIMSTNPDMNHVKTEFLLKADEIYYNSTQEEYTRTEYNKDISVHIAPTHLNTHLPSTFYEDTARGRPDWWVARYLKGSFQNKEGLVFPQYEKHIVDDFEIPDHWQRRIGGDFGLNNPTGFASLATDPSDGTTYIYWEHKESQKPVSYHAKVLTDHINTLSYNVIKTMVGDAAGQQRTAGDLSSVFDHYAEYGVYWSPSTKKLEDSIMKMFNYFELGKLKIFKSCNEFIGEIQTYRYPERSLDKVIKNENALERPIAINDHLIDGVRYVVAELPDDPNSLINKSYASRFTMRMNNKVTTIPHELQSNKKQNSYSRKDTWMSY